MGSVRFRLPSPSMAVALLALFVALGGSSLNPPGGANRIFTLPPGYRPDQNGAQGASFLVTKDGSLTAVVSVDSDGGVRLLNSATEHVAINGITFRATH